MPTLRAALILAPCLMLLAPSPAPGQHRLSARPDSLTNVLGLDLEKEGLEERSGVGLVEFRLYTSDERSRVTWRVGDALYVYAVEGDRHQERVLALMDAMRADGLWTFVAERRGQRVYESTEVRRVVAIQLQTLRSPVWR